jgi:hypothetical protein
MLIIKYMYLVNKHNKMKTCRDLWSFVLHKNMYSVKCKQQYETHTHTHTEMSDVRTEYAPPPTICPPIHAYYHVVKGLSTDISDGYHK